MVQNYDPLKSALTLSSLFFVFFMVLCWSIIDCWAIRMNWMLTTATTTYPRVQLFGLLIHETELRHAGPALILVSATPWKSTLIYADTPSGVDWKLQLSYIFPKPRNFKHIPLLMRILICSKLRSTAYPHPRIHSYIPLKNPGVRGWWSKSTGIRVTTQPHTSKIRGGRGGLTPPRIRVSGYAEYKFLVRGFL